MTVPSPEIPPMSLKPAYPALLLAAVASLTMSGTAQATAAYAKQTGETCGQCHQSAAGGGALTASGKAFQANGDKRPKASAGADAPAASAPAAASTRPTAPDAASTSQ